MSRNRSPDRRHSPGYGREAEWHRFQGWDKRGRLSPGRTSPFRGSARDMRGPPGQRMDRSPPRDWGRRLSPPRSQHPRDWGRRSPQGWERRNSPPRYGPRHGHSPPRGRSPPRWGPPPPEWDRYRGHSSGHSPPRFGPLPPQWDARGMRPPPPHPVGQWMQPPVDNHQIPAPNGNSSLPPALVSLDGRSSPESVKMDEGSGEEDNSNDYELPDYQPDVAFGQKYVIAVSGFFCKVCHKFYNSEASAKINHCQSRNHYDKFSKWVDAQTQEALAHNGLNEVEKVRMPNPDALESAEKTSNASFQVEHNNLEPVKQDAKEAANDGDQGTLIDQYDPSVPVADEEEETTSASSTAVYAVVSEDTSGSEKASSDGFVEATLYNFRKMRVQQLKENLKRRNLPSHGLKTLLLKRLEKALLTEAAEVAEAEEEEDREDMRDKDENYNPESQALGVAARKLRLTMHESDIEVANNKCLWITKLELERELQQITGVSEVLSLDKHENKMGRKTIVEWTIIANYVGEFPSDGLNFSLESHQGLPFRASLAEE